MATKDNTNYFPHDSNARNSDKLIRLRMRHGAEGYGVYFMILERLRDEPNYMSVKDYNMIAFDLRVDTSVIKSVVENFGLFVFTEDGKYFYSESFMRRMDLKKSERQKRSEGGKKAMAIRWSNDKSVISELSKTDKSVISELSKEKEKGKDKETSPPTPPYKEKEKEKEKAADDDITRAYACVREGERGAVGQSSSPTSVAVEDRLAVELRELSKESGWLDLVAMKYGITTRDVLAKFPDFELECRVNGKTVHSNLGDVKRHFSSWLRIIKTKGNGREQQSATAESYSKRRSTEVTATTAAEYGGRF